MRNHSKINLVVPLQYLGLQESGTICKFTNGRFFISLNPDLD
jgi:hypothetical protein